MSATILDGEAKLADLSIHAQVKFVHVQVSTVLS